MRFGELKAGSLCAALTTGRLLNCWLSATCSSGEVRNFTNASAASLCLVFWNTETLIPATWVMIGLLEPSSSGTSATAKSFMPAALRLFSVLFWEMSIPVLPLANRSLASGPWA